MDLQTAVPLDAQALLSAAQQGAETNPAEGWVRNLNTTALQSQLSSYQARLKTYIDSQNAGQSTPQPNPQRPACIQQSQFKYEIYADARSAAWGESPLMGFEAPTAALAGKKLTLAWVAASAADEAAIAALIPTPPRANS
jgi:uncharacterized protein